MDKLILVIYASNHQHAEALFLQLKNSEKTRDDIEFFVLVNTDKANTIECINPKLISEEEYKKVRETIANIDEELKRITKISYDQAKEIDESHSESIN